LTGVPIGAGLGENRAGGVHKHLKRRQPLLPVDDVPRGNPVAAGVVSLKNDCT